MMKKMDKKAFTLIELIVVIAIIGILVLLALPRFIGHTQKAELARIQHDVKAMEKEMGAEFINNDDDFNEWGNNIKDLNQLVQDDELFEKEGIAEEVDPVDGTYKVIPREYKDKINTKLKGTFYVNSHGKVYYEHTKLLAGIPTEPGEEEPEYSDKKIEDLIKEGYIPIATAEDLDSIRSNTARIYAAGTQWETENEVEGGLDKNYVQVKNINLSGYSEEGWTPIVAKEGWTPIGTDGNHLSTFSFTGTYDGGNYVIRGLEINGEGKYYQGLFVYAEGATIRNVGLEDVKVTGEDYVGGLVGGAYNSTIENSYYEGSVKGTGNYIGGLVGYIQYSKISNSYATGSVTGGSSVGGLVGEAYNTNISKSYATGEVTGESLVGGLVGYAYDNTTISNSYWNTETTNQTTSAGGAGKKTDEMKLKDTYEGWDFDTVWEIDEGNDYPTLR